MTDIPVEFTLPRSPARAVTTEWIKEHLERMDHTDPVIDPNDDTARTTSRS